MLRLRTFGTLDLRRADGAEIRPVVAQPRRAALLAYLAIASPTGFHRRDRLLPLFWPEHNASRARAALYRAIYFLRRELGSGVVISRGDELGLDPANFWCDARAFETAVRNGEPREAIELYAGELLPGFFPSGASGFEQWLEVERARLRERASQAAWALANHEEATGSLMSAAQWARRAVELAPFEEVGLRRLLALLDRAGDRAGAAQAYHRFADGIAEELELAPSPETRALIDTIRAREHARPEIVIESMDVSIDLGASPRTTSTIDSSIEPRIGQGRRRRVPTWAKAATTLALVSIGLVAAIRFGSAVDPTLVRVTDFANRTGDTTLNELARQTPAGIAAGLRQSALFEHVELARAPAAPSSAWHRFRGGVVRAASVRRWKRPALLVSGVIRTHEDAVVVDATIDDARTGGAAWPLPSVSVARTSPDSVIDRVRSRVLGGVAAIHDVASAHFFPIASTPPTFEAFEEYREGQKLLLRGQLKDAIQRFRWAAALDSTFTWPLVEAAIAGLRADREMWTDSVLVTLSRVGDRLGFLQRNLVAYVVATYAGNWPEACRALRAAAELAPERYAYSYAISASHVNRPREVVTALSRPGFDTLFRNATLTYWYVLTSAHHQLGEHERELAAARRGRAYRQRSIAALTQEIRALAALDRSTAVLSLLDSMAMMPGEGWFTPAWAMEIAARELRAHGHGDAARTALERAVAWHRHRPIDEEATEAHRVQLADVLYLLGDLDEAKRHYTALVAMDRTNPAYLASLGAIAARQGQRATAKTIEAKLRTFERAVPAPGNDAIVGRARIAAALGEHRRAMDLLVQAFGLVGTDMLHDDADFDALRGDPRFREFVRPKG